ncbi:mechanosensitive ion channel family protein [Massilibacterium senegalense]|uniref:mechanosensitive ion channel family protein n=1 Tax=Massilibacterium senegalense TaxID=1632858 RepID=UPI000781794D|nr:mechanosensitive ion channel family protein [Massilibacterium senegalense]
MMYVTDADLWLKFGKKTLKIILIIIVSQIVVKVIKTAIANVFNLRIKSPLRYSEKREETLSRLIQNVVTYVIYFIALIMILEEMSVPVKSLLAGAGIVGLAVGFGAQSLVKDIITGFFIVFEDQFAVGDYVQIGQFEGTVEEIGLRTTKIKNWTGEVHILPNSSIIEVTNFSLYNSIAVVDVSIAYEEDIDRAEQMIQEYLKTIENKYDEIVSPPEVLGVQMLGSSDVMIRIVAETLPMNHIKIARVLRKEVKQYLDEHGIEIPYPRMVLLNQAEEKMEEVRHKEEG